MLGADAGGGGCRVLDVAASPLFCASGRPAVQWEEQGEVIVGV